MGMPKVLKYFALFLDGTSYAGEVESVVLPKLKRKLEDFRAGGMLAPAKTDHGMEGLEVEVTAGGWMKEILKQFGNAKADGVAMRFTGALQSDDDGEWHAVEVHMRGRWEEVDMGSAKAGDKSEFKAKLAINYYRLVWDGEELIEIDLINLIAKFGGVDVYAEVRKALGI